MRDLPEAAGSCQKQQGAARSSSELPEAAGSCQKQQGAASSYIMA